MGYRTWTELVLCFKELHGSTSLNTKLRCFLCTWISLRMAFMSVSPGSLNIFQSCLYWKYLQRPDSHMISLHTFGTVNSWDTHTLFSWHGQGQHLLWTWYQAWHQCQCSSNVTHLSTGSVFFNLCLATTGRMTETIIWWWCYNQVLKWSNMNVQWCIKSGVDLQDLDLGLKSLFIRAWNETTTSMSKEWLSMTNHHLQDYLNSCGRQSVSEAPSA